MTNDLISKKDLIEALESVRNCGLPFTFEDLINSAPVVNADAVAIDVNKMVDRFLGWKLPHNFFPDAGITFSPREPHDSPYWPIGTNLFTATQAKAMFEHCIHYQSDFNLEYTAKRIRRLLNALDIPDPSNGNDNTLMGCLFSLLGQACSKLEAPKPLIEHDAPSAPIEVQQGVDIEAIIEIAKRYCDIGEFAEKELETEIRALIPSTQAPKESEG